MNRNSGRNACYVILREQNIVGVGINKATHRIGYESKTAIINRIEHGTIKYTEINGRKWIWDSEVARLRAIRKKEKRVLVYSCAVLGKDDMFNVLSDVIRTYSMESLVYVIDQHESVSVMKQWVDIDSL